MIGGCTVRPNLCLVHERAPNNLFDLLHGMEDPVYIPYMEKAAMLYDVARGLQVREERDRDRDKRQINRNRKREKEIGQLWI